MNLIKKYFLFVFFNVFSLSLIAQNGTTNITDPSISLPSGFYDYSGSNTMTHNTWWHLFNSRHINTTNDYSFQLIADFFNENNFFFRLNQHALNNTRGTLHRIWHSGNFNLSNNSFGVDLKGVNNAGIWHNVERSNGIFFGPGYSSIRVNNRDDMFNVNTTGIGIGTNAPQAKLHVKGLDGSSGFNPQEDLLHVGGNELGGYGGYAGIRIGGTSSGMYYTAIRSVKTGGYGDYWNNALTFSVMKTNTYTNLSEVLRITSGENVGIGTTTPSEKLTVNGNIKAKKLIISQQNWSDYVFFKNYKLRPLNELEKFILKHQHLPDVPSTKEIQTKGINVGDTQALLLKKIEELTLYIIELKKENIDLNNRLKKLELKN